MEACRNAPLAGALPPDWFDPVREGPMPAADPTGVCRRPSVLGSAWARFRRNRMAVAGLAVLMLMLAAVVLAPHLVPFPYYRIDLAHVDEPPGPRHWFGTDQLGRDIFARTWIAGRVSLLIGLTAAIIDLAVGVVYGGIAGLVGGWLEEVMMRVVDVLYGVPFLLVAILLLVLLGPGPRSVVAAIALVNWLGMARLVRGQVLLLKEQGYVLAARALGVPGWRILVRHLLPNASGPILVWLSYNIPAAIFAEALLSYVGIGIQPPLTSWGAMLGNSSVVLRIHPAQFVFPAAALSLTMLALYAVGDGLRDALDPRTGPRPETFGRRVRRGAEAPDPVPAGVWRGAADGS